MRPTLLCVAASCSNFEGRSSTGIGDHRNARCGDLFCHQPAFAHPDEHQSKLRKFLLQREYRTDVRRALDRDVEGLRSVHHRHQRRGIEPREQHVLALNRVVRQSRIDRNVVAGLQVRRTAGAGEPGIVAVLPRLAQRIAQQSVRADAASACNPRAVLAEHDELERPRAHNHLRVGTKIDHRALPAEDR